MAETWITDELATLREAGLERALTPYDRTGVEVASEGQSLLNFSSNDYLGLARHSRVQAAAIGAINRFGAGATASRLVTGTLTCHQALESRIAALKGYPPPLCLEAVMPRMSGSSAPWSGEAIMFSSTGLPMPAWWMPPS